MEQKSIKSKIFHDLASLNEVIAKEKSSGQKIVFTNGCFDLIHVGHVSYLEEAKALGDYLIVALNTDASVSRLKGAHRPIVSEDNRMKVIAALGSVDAVILFNEETPILTIEALMPDILVKGGDWAVDQIVGNEAVAHNGGLVMSLPYLESNSTTDIERRILKIHGLG